ncbi:MAG: transposase [Alphaproteobacteria bacterium]|nr:MAG: transposase [Alphaproteobacteria bacterium]
MPRKPRIEFEGAHYHVMARGNRGAEIFFDRQDSIRFLDLLGEIAAEEDWTPLAWCLMPNHYHLLVRTNRPTLSHGMQRLNGRYAAYASRTHDLGGHLLQGRYKAILVDRDTYLKELVRYIALNPVRAGLAQRPEQWIWGSYRALTSGAPDSATPWYDPAAAQKALGDTAAQEDWQRFVEAGLEADKPRVDLTENQLQHCSALGSKSFLQNLASRGASIATTASIDQAPIETYAKATRRRGEAMAKAHLEGGHRQRDIAAFFGVDSSTVSKAVSKYR